MLKKTDRLIEKYKDKKVVPKKLSVKFALPDVWINIYIALILISNLQITTTLIIILET